MIIIICHFNLKSSLDRFIALPAVPSDIMSNNLKSSLDRFIGKQTKKSQIKNIFKIQFG